MGLPRPFRRKTIEEIERETELSRYGAAAWRRTAKSVPLVGRESLRAYEERPKGRSLRDRLMEDLSDAWSDEEKAKVIEHYIKSVMSHGYRRQAAERRIIRLLTEAEESEEVS